MSEIKSYKLADDGNMVTIMMKDGTVHNSLIFLDEGKLCTVQYSLNKMHIPQIHELFLQLHFCSVSLHFHLRLQLLIN